MLYRYIPNDRLMFEYPDDYHLDELDDLESVENDSDMLRHDDPPIKRSGAVMVDVQS